MNAGGASSGTGSGVSGGSGISVGGSSGGVRPTSSLVSSFSPPVHRAPERVATLAEAQRPSSSLMGTDPRRLTSSTSPFAPSPLATSSSTITASTISLTSPATSTESDSEVEARKAKKLEELNKLKEELAKKRVLVQKQAVEKEVSDKALQDLLANLEMKKQLRREKREQRREQKALAGESKSITSLADLQNAIKTADERKRDRALRLQERKARRQSKREIIKDLGASGIRLQQDLTPEEKAIKRESRRLKRESHRLTLTSKEIHIDNQLTNFLQSILKLEEMIKQQETLRIQRQVELEMAQKENEELKDRVKKAEELLDGTKTKLATMSGALAKAAMRHNDDQELSSCQRELNEIHQHLGMEIVTLDAQTIQQLEEQKRAEALKRTEELQNEAAQAAEEGQGVGGLLAALRGAKLKKVEPESKPNAPPPPPAEGTGLLDSLQDTLRGALEMRKLSLMDSDSEDSDSDDYWSDEDDVDLDDADLMNLSVRM